MKNILGHRDFASHSLLRRCITKSVNYQDENVSNSELLCFFGTSKQRTWLVITEKRLYIILDDIRKQTIRVNKSYRISDIKNGNKFKIKVTGDYKTLYGKIYFKDISKGWLYSKKMFPNPRDLFLKIARLINRTE